MSLCPRCRAHLDDDVITSCACGWGEVADERESDNCVTCGKLTEYWCPDCKNFCCPECVTASEFTACKECSERGEAAEKRCAELAKSVFDAAAANIREQMGLMRRAQG